MFYLNLFKMTLFDKALANLDDIGIQAFEDNDTIYVYCGVDNDIPVEIAIYEIEFQASEYDRKKEEIEEL